MKIISNYKDIYDSINMYGIDEKNIFLRMPIIYNIDKSFNYKQKNKKLSIGNDFKQLQDLYNSDFSSNEELVNLINKNHKSYVSFNDYFFNLIKETKTTEGEYKSVSFNIGLFLFCGQIIPCILYFNKFLIKFKKNIINQTTTNNDLYYFSPDDVFYPQKTVKETEESLLHWIKSIVGEKNMDNWLKEEGFKKSGFKETIDFLTKNQEKDQSNLVNSILKKMNVSYLFCVLKNPIDIIVYPSLKIIKFSKYMDIMTIYQEISMHQGTLAHDPNPPIEISDKDKQQSKGFGHKYAFKKRKNDNDI